ncbi:MAG: hypothetical protein IKE66_10730 [Hyphomicrobium sp.]|jgi:hypothetical protein|nr:hypothetical protein [Hyphomicrobium sp.]
MSAEDDDDEVGYCKPPKHSRFKPGQSGNTRGRPRKNRSIEAMIKRELDQTVVLKEGGREIRLSKREALIKQLVNRAISGDQKPMQLVLSHLEKHKDIEPFTATEADDAELLKALGSTPIGDDNDEG